MIAEKQREAADRLRQEEFEAYQLYAQEQRRREWDEVTDTAERVHAPLSHTINFVLSPEGLVGKHGERLREVVEGGVAEAYDMAQRNSDWFIELERGRIDLEELDAIEALAREGEGAGAIISYWLIPDAVRYGDSTLPGYNRERLKMFTRIAVPTAEGVAVRYHSYDGSYIPGVAAMDRALGFEYDFNRGSEQVARERRRIHVPVSSINELDELLRVSYDTTLQQHYRGEWYSGRRSLPTSDIIGFIYDQPDLLAEHMTELNKIFASTTNSHERNRRMEPLRYNLAAAIEDRLHGKIVVSVSDAGEAARAEGRDLSGDCPTGEGTLSEQQLALLGFKTGNNINKEKAYIWSIGECRTCLHTTAVAVNGCSMCKRCADAHSFGGDVALDQIMRDAKARRLREIARRQRRAGIGKQALEHTK